MVMLRGENTAKGLDAPTDTVVSSGLHHGLVGSGQRPLPFMLSYYGTDNMRGVEQPVATVVTVDRHGLVEPGEELRLEDCTFRMLQPHEIQAAMAFPPEYVVLGNNREQVRQLGQAVTPPVMKMLVERCVETLR
jgi:DNA (cytosine-5)-methyltransferase 1